ncbi:hypothetical protein VTL71DRAFT_332, partial [Oculimacula yallundae]
MPRFEIETEIFSFTSYCISHATQATFLVRNETSIGRAPDRSEGSEAVKNSWRIFIRSGSDVSLHLLLSC